MKMCGLSKEKLSEILQAISDVLEKNEITIMQGFYLLGVLQEIMAKKTYDEEAENQEDEE